MRYFLSYIALSFFILSCSSPFDVDVNDRDDIVVDIPDPNAPILFASTDHIDFEYLDLNSPSIKTVTVKNLRSSKYSIRDISFQKLTSPFYLDDLNLPIELAPNGNEGDEIEISINCVQMVTGHIIDDLVFFGDSNLIVKVESKVADLYVNDLRFTPVDVNGVDIKYLNIVNNGDTPIKITDFELSGQGSEAFSIQNKEDEYTLGIGTQNNTLRIPVIFNPKNTGEFNLEINIIHNGTGLLKDISKIYASTV